MSKLLQTIIILGGIGSFAFLVYCISENPVTNTNTVIQYSSTGEVVSKWENVRIMYDGDTSIVFYTKEGERVTLTNTPLVIKRGN